MNINELLNSKANIQIVVNVADLKEAFQEWAKELKEMSGTEDSLLTVDDACAMLKCDRSTLWRWGKSGYIRKRTIGGKVYYLLSDVKRKIKAE